MDKKRLKINKLCISAVINYLMTKVVFEFVSLTQQGIEQRQKKKKIHKIYKLVGNLANEYS